MAAKKHVSQSVQSPYVEIDYIWQSEAMHRFFQDFNKGKPKQAQMKYIERTIWQNLFHKWNSVSLFNGVRFPKHLIFYRNEIMIGVGSNAGYATAMRKLMRLGVIRNYENFVNDSSQLEIVPLDNAYQKWIGYKENYKKNEDKEKEPYLNFAEYLYKQGIIVPLDDEEIAQLKRPRKGNSTADEQATSPETAPNLPQNSPKHRNIKSENDTPNPETAPNLPQKRPKHRNIKSENDTPSPETAPNLPQNRPEHELRIRWLYETIREVALSLSPDKVWNEAREWVSVKKLLKNAQLSEATAEKIQARVAKWEIKARAKETTGNSFLINCFNPTGINANLSQFEANELRYYRNEDNQICGLEENGEILLFPTENDRDFREKLTQFGPEISQKYNHWLNLNGCFYSASAHQWIKVEKGAFMNGKVCWIKQGKYFEPEKT